MKTDDLIRVLSADPEVEKTPLALALVYGLLPGIAVSAVLYALLLGPRPDLLDLITQPRILFKIIYPLALFACAGPLALRLARPTRRSPAFGGRTLDPASGACCGRRCGTCCSPARSLARETHRPQCALLHGRNSELGRGAAHRRACCSSPGRAEESEPRRRRCRTFCRRFRRHPLRHALPRQFAALRCDLVRAGDPYRDGGRRDRRIAVPALVGGWIDHEFLGDPSLNGL